MKDIDYTIKPLTTSIEIKTLRRLIASWYSNGLTDAQVHKMLWLYLGEPAWMNINKMYTVQMFGEMARELKFRTTQSMLETMLKCKGFGKIWKNEKDGHKFNNLEAFYTPCWYQATEEQKADLQQEQENLHPGDAYIINNNISKKKIYKRKITSKYAKRLQDANGADERKKVIEDCAKDLLYFIAQNDDPYNAIIKPINDLAKKQLPELYIDSSVAHPMSMVARRFFNAYVWPYLLSHSEKMMSINTERGQVIWLERVINLGFMQKKLAQAVSDIKLYLVQHSEELIRMYHPISAFEYQDKTSGQRFYDDTLKDGTLQKHRIPQEAPPRPSASAIWSKFEQKWKNA